MYADKITDSMQQTIDETGRRREKQVAYNALHGITPTQVKKGHKTIFEQSGLIDDRKKAIYQEMTIEESIAADPLIKTMNHDQLRKTIEQTKKNMERAAKDMDFMEAARLRDEMFALQKLVDNPTVS